MNAKTRETLASILIKMDRGDLLEANKMLTRIYKSIGQAAIINFGVGDKVIFKGKRGMQVVGTITKINRTTISVLADNGVRWKCNPGGLSKV